MTITKQMVFLFCELVGDENPIHSDEQYAATTKFEKCIVPGTLVNGLIGGIIAASYPGAILITQELGFWSPVYIDHQIEFKVSETRIDERKSVIHVTVMEGETTLMTSKSLIYKSK